MSARDRALYARSLNPPDPRPSRAAKRHPACLWLSGLALAALALFAGSPALAKPPKGEPAKKCAPGESSVKGAPLDLKLKCKDGWKDCETDIPLKAQNCTSGFVEFVRLEMYEKDRRSLSLEFSPASIVPPGGTWKEQVPWTTPGEMEAVVYYRTAGESATDAARFPVKVANKGLDDAHAACDRCQGTWGRYGLNQNEGCNCRAADAGKTCHDGDDCQGQCLFMAYDNKGNQIGKCSDNQRVVGCAEIVEKGATKLKPVMPPPRKHPVCF